MTQPEVLVVSVFGRGHWPAVELAEKGFRVQLVDMTERLGRWAPEDWEGPFGFFHAENLIGSQVARLSAEDYSETLNDGFTVWPKDGPLDMRGRLSSDWVERLPAYGMAKEYLQERDKATASERDNLIDDLLLAGFEKNWLAQLSHQLASPIFQPNALSLNSGDPLPLWSPFHIRRVTRKGLQKSLEWCRGHGVDVIAGASLVDVALEGSRIHAVELGGEVSRAITPETVIWCLSSTETEHLAPKITAQLYPRGVLRPEWNWMRWRLQGQLGLYSDVVPKHMVVIEDLGLPWTHTNLLVIQSCEVVGSFDVWARIPSHHRFQRGYCEEFGQELLTKLAKRLPGFTGSVQDQPQDYHYDAAQLGPAIFPVFNEAERSSWSAKKIKNLYHEGVEWLTHLDWTGRFARQSEIVAELVEWRKVKLQKLAKGGGGDRSVHTP